MNPADTIVAISSSVNSPAARIIVRMSGSDAARMASAISGSLPDPGAAAMRRLSFDGMDLSAWIYFFAGPRSYTGEDVIEFHLPGSTILAGMLLKAMVERGARHAEAGEFTARAYFAGRIDLTQAEGVAASIDAHGQQELRAARQLLAGELARRLAPEIEHLAETLALVEAGIDFSDEGVAFLSAQELSARIDRIDSALHRLIAGSARFEPLAHEPSAVLIGRPNAGKSTLLNALAQTRRAIVSPIAGTTRDVLCAEVTLQRGMIRLLDAAGIEPDPAGGAGPATDSTIENQMRQRALSALEQADHVIVVQDIADAGPTIALQRRPDLIVRTKLDLHPDRQRHERGVGLHRKEADPPVEAVAVSALSGQGMLELRNQLDALAFGQSAPSASLALNARHLGCLAEAREALARARRLVDSAGSEMIAFELRESLDSLGRVLGPVTPDDVLGRVFSTFCIGK